MTENRREIRADRNVRAHFIILPLLALLLTSCEETVGTDIELPYEREIVVQGFLTAGEVDTLLIIQTLPPLESWSIDKGALPDAEVTVTAEGEELPMRYVDRGRWVPDGWVPQEGTAYRLRVESEGDVVTATAQVPARLNRAIEIVPDTVRSGCTTFDYETGEELTVDLARLIVRIVAPETARFQARYAMVETYRYGKDSIVSRNEEMRAWYYEYTGDGTALIVLREFCGYDQIWEGERPVHFIDSVYLRLYEFEPAYTRFYETQWRDNDDEFFGPTGEDPAWNVSGDGFGWLFGRNVTRDTVAFR